MPEISRRGLLSGLVAGAAGTATLMNAGCGEAKAPEPPAQPQALKEYPNDHFYGPDGAFDAAKAKDAYYELMDFYKFPVMPVLKTDAFWVLDFGLGKFTEVGMGGVFYLNEKEGDYLLHDIWLLPNQMIPEHSHVEWEDVAPKMEGWLVRHGSAYFGSEAEPTPDAAQVIPPSHKDVCKARHVLLRNPGEVTKLQVPKAWHWMKAGPQGAIATEVATYHAMEALRFSHPDIHLG